MGSNEGERGIGLLYDTVRVEFDAANGWSEEDTAIAVYPKNPFRPVDVVHSMQLVRVLMGGRRGGARRVVVGSTCTRQGCRRPASSTGRCCGLARRVRSVPTRERQIKGEGKRETGEEEVVYDRNLVWYYRTPTTECA